MTQDSADFRQTDADGVTVLALSGPLTAVGIAALWSPVLREAARTRGRELVLDLTEVSLCDTAGTAFLLEVETAHGAPARLDGASAQALALLDRGRAITVRQPPATAPAGAAGWLMVLSSGLYDTLRAGLLAAIGGIAFLGEVALAILRAPARRRMFRVSDMLRTADQAGVRAVALLVLMGFLIGLILAFQSLIAMRRYGGELYVANLVSISLLRELGPLLAAVILAGRTGSAFAAEIGTMKVNEEVDALVTMGLDPVTMLVLPRLAAILLVMPAMTLVMDLAGLAGMTAVMMGNGFPYQAIATQVAYAARPQDLYGGLFKAMCFGAAIAAIGCRSGLATGVGPRAVGLSATAAVVGGIVATIVLDGLFAVLFNRLGL